MISAIRYIGRFLIDLVFTAGRGVVLFFQAIGQCTRAHQNVGKIVYQEKLCGLYSIPVVLITAVFTGMVLSAQVGQSLINQVGYPYFLGGIVGVSVFRELGPVLTAVVVTGFVGGGISSVLATMRVNEEIDALEVMSINPVRFLVMPRLLAMIVAVPLLTAYADAIGILGGAVVAEALFGVPYQEFFSSCFDSMDLRDLSFGLLKGMVFGIIICIIACEQGFSASGGAEGVGRSTMRTVVYSFLMILVVNFLMYTLVWRLFLSTEGSI